MGIWLLSLQSSSCVTLQYVQSNFDNLKPQAEAKFILDAKPYNVPSQAKTMALTEIAQMVAARKLIETSLQKFVQLLKK